MLKSDLLRTNINVSQDNQIELYLGVEPGWSIAIASLSAKIDHAEFGEYLVAKEGHSLYKVIKSNQTFKSILLVDIDCNRTVYIPSIAHDEDWMDENNEIPFMYEQPANSKIVLSELYESDEFSVTINQIVKEVEHLN